MRHELKILPQHFTPVLDEIKTAELRKNDRNFAAGDTLLLMEWSGDYTGDACERVVTHVADVGDYLPGYVLLSMVPQPQPSTNPQIDNDVWIEWGGNGPTVALLGKTVKVRYQDNDTDAGSTSHFYWGRNCGNPIIAYRVIDNEN